MERQKFRSTISAVDSFVLCEIFLISLSRKKGLLCLDSEISSIRYKRLCTVLSLVRPGGSSWPDSLSPCFDEIEITYNKGDSAETGLLKPDSRRPFSRYLQCADKIRVDDRDYYGDKKMK